MSTLPAVDTRSSSSEAAFAELYERNADRIFGFCRRRLRSRQEAEDAVQETFVSAMRAIQRGSVPVCESAWLFKIAENVCFAAYRAGARRHVRDLTDSERIARLASGDGGADSLFGLQDALDTLPVNQRRAFVLRELRGLSYKEIAIQLGVSVASVETLIYRARRGLARALEGGAGLRGRVTASLNLGSILASVKGWFAGATAVKIASAAAVAAIASTAVADAPLEARKRPAPRAVQPAPIQESPARAASARRGGPEARPTPTTLSSRPRLTKPGPRPQRKQAPPADAAPAPAVDNSVPAETLVVRPGSTPPVSAPQPPVSAPPLPPASEPVKVQLPDVPLVPDVPAVGAPGLPDVPAPGELLPEVPPLPLPDPQLPPLPKVPLLP